MIELVIFFISYIAFQYYYQVMIDALEFTCINYDELFLDSTQIYVPEVKTTAIKYEDKYKSDLFTIPNEIVVNQQDVTKRFDTLLKQSIAEITDKINKELLAYESELNNETEYNVVDQRAYFINDKMEQMKMELWARILVKDDILELAESQLIQDRLTNLKYSFVMEHTPVGNVIMFYNSAREAFEYYSDNVVPYRYLDTVCRKYVIMNLCVPLYVDMNEELKEVRRKAEQCKQEDNEHKESMTKSNVFVKLKNYKKPSINKESAILLQKARTNKYLYNGRMNNFNFMKQTETKPILSYAEYKQRLLNK